MQLTKDYEAEMSCKHVVIDSAVSLLKVKLPLVVFVLVFLLVHYLSSHCLKCHTATE